MNTRAKLSDPSLSVAELQEFKIATGISAQRISFANALASIGSFRPVREQKRTSALTSQKSD